MDTTDDVRAAQAGHREAFRRLVARFQPVVAAYALAWVPEVMRFLPSAPASTQTDGSSTVPDEASCGAGGESGEPLAKQIEEAA